VVHRYCRYIRASHLPGPILLEQCFDGDLVILASPPNISVPRWAFEYVDQSAGYARGAVTRLLSNWAGSVSTIRYMLARPADNAAGIHTNLVLPAVVQRHLLGSRRATTDPGSTLCHSGQQCV
jgi:hypothetical protein